MDIRKVNDDDLSKYDNLIDNSIEGTLFHKSWWLAMFKNYYGKSYNVEFYGIFEDNDLIAGLPIPTHNKFGIKFVYHPKLTPYLGPFYILREKKYEKKYVEISQKKKINEDFANILNKMNCIYYSFYNNTDLQPFKWNGFDIGVCYTYILDLKNLDKVWEDMDKKRRNDINKSYKHNYDIRYNRIEDFVELNKKTMERQGHKILSENLWVIVFNNCKQKGCCEIFTAYKDDVAMASLFLVWDNKRSYYLASGINYNSEGVMSLLIWEAIKYTKEKLKLNEFDFEGSDVRGIEFFFRKFGGDVKPIFYISENSTKKRIIMKIFNFLKKG